MPNSFNITEKIIEDIFTADTTLLAHALSVSPTDLSMIARQKRFANHKIMDMLYLHKNEILLIELKATPFYYGIIEQINGYYDELRKLQEERKLISAKINKIILATDAATEHFAACRQNDIQLIKFDIENILTQYYDRFRELSTFLRIQPAQRGVSSLYLIKTTLQWLAKGLSFEEILQAENKSSNTIHNNLAVSNLLGLVDKPHRNKREYSLTAMGARLLASDDGADSGRFSMKQVEIIADFVKENPFYSQISFSIMSVVDTIFILSKAEYPVKYDVFQDFFIRSLGKDKTWKQNHSQYQGTAHFVSYAMELGFIHKVGNAIFLTPKGTQALLP